MYVITFWVVFGYAFMKTLKHAEAHKAETGTPLEWSNRISHFMLKFTPALIMIWIIESYVYYKILFMDPTP